MTPTRRAALLAPLLLAGCHLWDQTDVPPALGGAPPVPPAKPKPPPTPAGPRPLVTIHPGPDVAYQSTLREAVGAALARKPDVAFDVVAAVPVIAAAATQIPTATEIARAIVSQGVPASRVSLSARTDPDVKAPEIRVYVH